MKPQLLLLRSAQNYTPCFYLLRRPICSNMLLLLLLHLASAIWGFAAHHSAHISDRPSQVLKAIQSCYVK
jgi:hypothetical protein